MFTFTSTKNIKHNPKLLKNKFSKKKFKWKIIDIIKIIVHKNTNN